MKKSYLKRKSKSNSRKYQDKLWQLCKKIIRSKYPNVCYTCGRSGLEGSNWHTGHLWPKATLGMNLKYDIRILRPQCYNCNINLGGNGAVFYEKMSKENPQLFLELLEEKKKLVKADAQWFEQKINQYETLLNEIT